MTVKDIKRQLSVIKSNYKFLGYEFNLFPSDKTVYAEYYDIRGLDTRYSCVRVIYRNKEPLNMQYCVIPVEFICKDIKFGGF